MSDDLTITAQASDVIVAIDVDNYVVVEFQAVGVNDALTAQEAATTAEAAKTAAEAAAEAALGASTDVVETAIHAATSKTTPADADEMALVDSAASNVLKKLTWANLKATLKTYFDTVYTALALTTGLSAADKKQVRQNIGGIWTLYIFTASDPAWPVPAWASEMILAGWGGGGSGAGGDTSTNQRGSGAGGGAYFWKHYTGTMDTTLAITVGAGGAAVTSTSGGADGNNGGTTSVVGTNLGTLTANGGSKGLKGINSGGIGGSASGGDINLKGEDGATSWSTLTLAAAHKGGSAPRGGFGGAVNVGNAGQIPGGGGACGNHTTSANSGAGAPGRVHILVR